jgi:DNA invertase Pin-like site-specific DNA recombinase
MKRVAIYARVSTADKNQDPEMQLKLLREFSERNNFDLVGEYIDHASGSKNDREGYQQVLDLAKKRQVDVVLVYSYDRFARSTLELVKAVDEFRELRVDFISYHQNINTTTAEGKLYFTILAGIAEFEREMIRRRVMDGLALARSRGKRLGRPPLSKREKDKIIATWKKLGSMNATRKKLNKPYSTVKKVVDEYKREVAESS